MDETGGVIATTATHNGVKSQPASNHRSDSRLCHEQVQCKIDMPHQGLPLHMRSRSHTIATPAPQSPGSKEESATASSSENPHYEDALSSPHRQLPPPRRPRVRSLDASTVKNCVLSSLRSRHHQANPSRRRTLWLTPTVFFVACFIVLAEQLARTYWARGGPHRVSQQPHRLRFHSREVAFHGLGMELIRDDDGNIISVVGMSGSGRADEMRGEGAKRLRSNSKQKDGTYVKSSHDRPSNAKDDLFYVLHTLKRKRRPTFVLAAEETAGSAIEEIYAARQRKADSVLAGTENVLWRVASLSSQGWLNVLSLSVLIFFMIWTYIYSS